MRTAISLFLVLACVLVLGTLSVDASAEEPSAFRALTMDGNSKAKMSRSRSFTIWYSPNIDSTSFKATLNGVDVSNRFNPQPNGIESVQLLFRKGLNRLTIESGNEGSESLAVQRKIYEIDYRGLEGALEAHVEASLGLSDEEVRALARKKGFSVRGQKTN